VSDLLRRGLGLGRVLGIPVRLDLSWFAGLLLFVAVSRELWADLPGTTAALLAVGFSLAYFASVLVHELAHALAARALGVPTAEIRLFVFGGVARIRGEPPEAGGEALMAMAGPLASVTLAGLLALAATATRGSAADLLGLLFAGNLVLAAFNLLPGFPLDGGRIARALLWRATGRRLLATRVTAWAGRGLAGALVAGSATAALWQQTPRFLLHVALGLFLWRAAVDGERAARVAELLAGRRQAG
jgi:Zn-dependent protease